MNKSKKRYIRKKYSKKTNKKGGSYNTKNQELKNIIDSNTDANKIIKNINMYIKPLDNDSKKKLYCFAISQLFTKENKIKRSRKIFFYLYILNKIKDNKISDCDAKLLNIFQNASSNGNISNSVLNLIKQILGLPDANINIPPEIHQLNKSSMNEFLTSKSSKELNTETCFRIKKR